MVPKYRTLTKPWRIAAVILPAVAIVLAAIHTFHVTILGSVMSDTAYLLLLLGLLLPLSFIWIPATKGADRHRVPWYDILLVCLSFGIPFYFYLRSFEINIGWGIVAPLEASILGAILWVVLIEAGRRAGGNIFAVVLLVLSTYPFYSSLMPGILRSMEFPVARVINYKSSPRKV